MRRILFGLALPLALEVPPVLHAQRATPRAGLVISRSTTFRSGTYHLVAPATTDSAVIIVRGSDVTLDLAGVHLLGAPRGSDPDRGSGVAILIDGGANITVKNAHIRGYKVGVLARGTRNLRLIDNDLSFNWKPRLYSIVEHESLADWLSFHRNEKDEWLRYGAAMYLHGVRGGEIRGNRVRQGMNALLMTTSDSMLVWSNDFSFNSGLGIGLYRSSHNRILQNRVDFNVRGYSEGFYRRGQDSAGILVYEQSDSNVVAYNSATHSGDGFFLWAGQHTMDTGQGGANDNVVTGNDFSWAVANGIEATFSRNAFVSNRLVGSEYGVWGGYSFNSLIANNYFARNRVGIAIEHGQENRIVANRFERDSTDIQLWANKIEPSDWGYPKHRDTRSRDYEIRWNQMSGARVGLRVSETSELNGRTNRIRADSALVSRGDTSNILVDSLAVVASPPVSPLDWAYPSAPTRLRDPRTRATTLSTAGGSYADWPRSTIIVDEWGPYDWKTPKLWPVDSSLATPLELRVLTTDSSQSWRLVRARGASVSRSRGRVTDAIIVTPTAGGIEEWTVSLEYSGQTFRYSRFDAKPSWNAKVYAWNDSTHPINASSRFAALLRGDVAPPVLSLVTTRLDYVWYRPRVPDWPQDRAAVVATTEVDLPSGDYTLRTISDDGIRVFIDDKLVIDEWTVHESLVREAPLGAGRHRVRVEYFQLDGWTELRAEIVKRD